MKHSKILLNHLGNKIQFSKIKIDMKSNLSKQRMIEICVNFGILNRENYFSEDDLEGLSKFVEIRNKISHGEKNAIVIESLDDIQVYILLITKLMDNWISLIEDFLLNEEYLKS